MDFVSRVPFFERSRPSGDTSSEQAIRTIKQWTDDCSNQHYRCCAAKKKSRLPKRILELTEERRDVCVPEPLLGPEGTIFHTDQGYPQIPESWHVFCQAPAYLQRGSRAVFATRYPLSLDRRLVLVPRSQSEIPLINGRGIIQQDKDDWKEAAATMADVYENAFITIAATRSSDSEGGCFSKIQGLNQPTQLESSGLYACKVVVDFPRSAYNLATEGGSWPLLHRAWVFQERLLSTRVIHFTDYQVIWECQSMQESETCSISETGSKTTGL
jgi:hypothetical protein